MNTPAQKRHKDHYGQQTAGGQIEVADRVFLHDPVVKKGRQYICIAEDIPRQSKLVQFNLLKSCSVPNPVDQQHRSNHTVSTLWGKDRIFHPVGS